MIKIDMTEEPEDEHDLIYKAQNIFTYDYIDTSIHTYKELQYSIPIKDKSHKTKYISEYYYKNIMNLINKYR